MKITDFHITGQYPTLSVETEVQDGQGEGDSSNSQSVRLNLGPWSYVSLLNEKELKSLVHLVYESQKHQATKAMEELKGASLNNASEMELP